MLPYRHLNGIILPSRIYVGYICYAEGSKLGLSCWLTQNRQKVVMYGTQNQRQEKNEGL